MNHYSPSIVTVLTCPNSGLLKICNSFMVLSFRFEI
nr:MAG TPA: hypothetical protein [Caudoviricetes sp.]